MKQIALLNPEDISEAEVLHYQTREAARAVVFDKDNLVALLYVSKENYYKLPGGGLEEGEDPLTALKRECREEIGCEIEVVGEIGSIVEYRKSAELRQTSYCYVAKVQGDKIELHLSPKETERGFKVVWLTYEKANEAIDQRNKTESQEGSFIIWRDSLFLKAAKESMEKEMEQKIQSTDIVNFYTELDTRGIKIWIDGGWGVDALLGEQSRPHKDLDIAINNKDVPGLLTFLSEQGFKEIRRSGEYKVVLADEKGREIDYHAFITDQAGHMVGGIAYPDESLTGMGSIDGQAVRCISPEYVVKFHSGYDLKDKDYHDVRAICEKFGIEIPKEYNRFRN